MGTLAKDDIMRAAEAHLGPAESLDGLPGHWAYHAIAELGAFMSQEGGALEERWIHNAKLNAWATLTATVTWETPPTKAGTLLPGSLLLRPKWWVGWHIVGQEVHGTFELAEPWSWEPGDTEHTIHLRAALRPYGCAHTQGNTPGWAIVWSDTLPDHLVYPPTDVQAVAEFVATLKAGRLKLEAGDATGGAPGCLWLHGHERGIPHIEGESAEAYRERITTLPDIITAPAIARRVAAVLRVAVEEVEVTAPNEGAFGFGLSGWGEAGPTRFGSFLVKIPHQPAPVEGASWGEFTFGLDAFGWVLGGSGGQAFAQRETNLAAAVGHCGQVIQRGPLGE